MTYQPDKKSKYYPILPVPQPPEPEPEEPTNEEQPEENKPGWDWIGSPSRPEAEEHDDGISDLFEVSDEDVGASDEDLSDLTDVDIERDIIDADEDGTLDDLTTVTEDDIMGDELGQRPSRPPSQQRRAKRRAQSRYQPPTSLGGMGD